MVPIFIVFKNEYTKCFFLEELDDAGSNSLFFKEKEILSLFGFFTLWRKRKGERIVFLTYKSVNAIVKKIFLFNPPQSLQNKGQIRMDQSQIFFYKIN